MSLQQEARDRYQLNSDGRKERDGFVCSKKTMCTACVAVKREEGMVRIRDTKDLSDTTLSFTDEEWKAFIGGVKDGEFDV